MHLRNVLENAHPGKIFGLASKNVLEKAHQEPLHRTNEAKKHGTKRIARPTPWKTVFLVK